MKKTADKKKIIGSGRYAVGRIRSLEAKLMDRQALDRLLAAESPADVRQLMDEHGYADGDIEQALMIEQQKLYDLVYEISPDPVYLDLIRLEEDLHNLKVGLRKLLVSPDEKLADYRHLYRETGLFNPEALDRDLRADELSAYPNWLQEAVRSAKDIYQETLDPARIDLTADKIVAFHQKTEAERLESEWLRRYFALIFDLKNAETLYRARRRDIGREVYEMSLLPDGMIARDKWLSLFEDEVADVPAYLATGPYQALSELVEYELQNKRQGNWSQAADLMIMEHLRETKRFLTGPEVPLGFLLSRRQEIRSIRLIEAAIRNGLPQERREKLVRQSYVERG
ncbi:MAG TPA: V-type ATPase subunit [Fastidiosipila sp.]|nr:V-type ATPase subunit [Fastidiosipila sp.]